jgi:hypothetical protein
VGSEVTGSFIAYPEAGSMAFSVNGDDRVFSYTLLDGTLTLTYTENNVVFTDVWQPVSN